VTAAAITKPRIEIPSLTGLRFFAAFAIVVHHTLLTVFAKTPGGVFRSFLANMGAFGMSLFFVLSGFIIYYTYYEAVRRFEFAKIYNFMVARVARLYPLFLALVLFDVIRMLHSGAMDLGSSRLLALPFFFTLTQSWFYMLVGGVPVTIPFDKCNITWSISTEFFLYSLFPILTMMVTNVTRRVSRYMFLIACMLVFVWVKVSISHHEGVLNQFALATFGGQSVAPNTAPVYTFLEWLRFNSPYVRIFEFILGISVGHLYAHFNEVGMGRIERRLLKVALYGCLVAMVWLSFWTTRSATIRGIYETIEYSPLIAVFILALISTHSAVRTFLERKRVTWLGELSYSLYVLHTLVFEKFGRPHLDGTYDYVLSTGRFILGCGLLLLLCTLTYNYIEVPARIWLRKKLSKPPVPRPEPVVEFQN
jgi:hypothetical protein